MSSKAENAPSGQKGQAGIGERIAELFNWTWEMEILFSLLLLSLLFLLGQGNEEKSYQKEVHVDTMLARMVHKDSDKFLLRGRWQDLPSGKQWLLRGGAFLFSFSMGPI